MKWWAIIDCIDEELQNKIHSYKRNCYDDNKKSQYLTQPIKSSGSSASPLWYNSSVHKHAALGWINWDLFNWPIENRAQWIRPSEQKTPKIKTGHVYSYVKLNFRVGLFSCIFLFEVIFYFFAQISPKIKIEIWPKLRPKVIISLNQSHRAHIWGMFEL